jgi:hypothetical protein
MRMPNSKIMVIQLKIKPMETAMIRLRVKGWWHSSAGVYTTNTPVYDDLLRIRLSPESNLTAGGESILSVYGSFHRFYIMFTASVVHSMAQFYC